MRIIFVKYQFRWFNRYKKKLRYDLFFIHRNFIFDFLKTVHIKFKTAFILKINIRGLTFSFTTVNKLFKYKAMYKYKKYDCYFV